MPPIPHLCYFFKKTKFFVIIPNFFFFLLIKKISCLHSYCQIPWKYSPNTCFYLDFFFWCKYYRFLTFIFFHDDTHSDLAIQSLLSLHAICCRPADDILKLKDVTKVNEYITTHTHLSTYSEIFFFFLTFPAWIFGNSSFEIYMKTACSLTLGFQ